MSTTESDSDQATAKRLLSLDVYRGMVMFALFAGGFGLAKVANSYPDNAIMQWLKFNTTHPEWLSQFKWFGFSLWDMIQPAFMFMVGVSMPYSYGKRQQLGDSYFRRLSHAWIRALVLVLLGVLLQSMGKPQTNWLFTNVLSQIGLGYGFLFFLIGRKPTTQLIIGAVVLFVYWLMMRPWGFDNGTSLPQRFDLWFLNLFPRATEFTGRAYSTLNFVPSFVTMLLGLLCGQLLKDREVSECVKLRRLLLGGLICLVVALAWSPLCPIVKKLWTPSWTLFSGAYVIWLLAFLYWAIDCKGWKQFWTVFFVVVGTNSIAAYFMGQLMKPFARGLFRTHLPESFWEAVGVWRPCVESILVAAFFWVVLLWMYRKRIFIRI
ncbi:MAG: hypothetical protein ACR2NZ_09925 [Rubripirellula sp.]